MSQNFNKPPEVQHSNVAHILDATNNTASTKLCPSCAEKAARICKEFQLTLATHKYPSTEERALIAIVEVGIRGALSEAMLAAAKEGK